MAKQNGKLSIYKKSFFFCPNLAPGLASVFCGVRQQNDVLLDRERLIRKKGVLLMISKEL